MYKLRGDLLYLFRLDKGVDEAGSYIIWFLNIVIKLLSKEDHPMLFLEAS